MDRLHEDVNACLLFLIAHQNEWKPNIDIHIGGGQTRKQRLLLVAVEEECITK